MLELKKKTKVWQGACALIAACCLTAAFAQGIDDDDSILPAIIARLKPICTLIQTSPTALTVGIQASVIATCTKSPDTYEWFANGVQVSAPSPSSSILYTPAISGTLTFAVVARKRSIRSNPFQLVTAAAPNSPPQITSFVVGPSTTSPNVPVAISTTATDPNAGDVVTLRAFVNGTPVGATTTNGALSTSWTPVKEGVYAVLVLATDIGGAQATSQTNVVVTVTPNVSLSIPTATVSVGTTPGSFAVSDVGAGTYSIPIAVPPGAAGLQPNLALTYNNQAGDGHLGIGWTLSGISAIYRCPRTPAQDNGTRQPINYDENNANDAYCLDGERLIRIGTPAFGQEEYRTERDGYSKIVAYREYDQDTNPSEYLLVGPSRFRVWTKGGRVLDFGLIQWLSSNGAPTRPNVAKAWPLSLVSDRAGNSMSIRYGGSVVEAAAPKQYLAGISQSSFGTVGPLPGSEYWPEEIVYTRNANTNPGTFSGIRLIHSLRPTTSKHILYDSGAGTSTLFYQLEAVETYTGTTTAPLQLNTANNRGQVTSWGTRVKRYDLSYSQSPATQRLRLDQIQESSGPAGSAVSLAPTVFAWNSASVGLNGPGSGSYSAMQDGSGTTGLADLNGDGKSDLVRFDAQFRNVHYCLSGATFQCNVVNLGSIPGTAQLSFDQPAIFADVDGDGKADVIAIEVTQLSGTTIHVCPSTGSTFGTCTPVLIDVPGAVVNGIFAGDFDGDGKVDLILQRGSNQWKVCLSQSTSSSIAFNCNLTYGPVPINNVLQHVLITDINGDGRADLIQRASANDSDANWYPCLADYGAGPGNTNALICATNPVPVVSGKLSKLTVFDFNGDGLADLATGSPTGQWQVALSTGLGVFSVSPWTGPFADVEDVVFGDFNGDGRTDIAKYVSGSQWQVCLSTGLNFSCSTWTSNVVPQAGGARDIRTGDFNGDGRTDLAVQTSAGQWQVGFANGPIGDFLRNATTGLGATTELLYQPLTSAVHDVTGVSTGPGEVLIRAPFYVVSQVLASTGTGGVKTQNYSYKGMKGENTGRGLLGFAERTITEPDANGPGVTATTTITYQQSWPLTGRPLTVTKAVDGSTVRLTTNQWASSASRLGYTGIWEVFGIESKEESWELPGGGGELPTVTTTTPVAQTDSYGNLLQVVTTASDGFTQTTTNAYSSADTVNWLLGSLTSATVTTTTPLSAPWNSATRRTSYTYYGAASAWPGYLQTETVEPQDTGDLKVSTSYQYDGWGNKSRADVTFKDGAGNVTRTTQWAYEALGRFPQTIIDPKNFQELRTYDSAYGGLLTSKLPNGTRSERTYDLFGRLTSESSFDAHVGGNLVARRVVYWDAQEIQGGEKYRKWVIDASGSETKTFYDSLQRELRTLTKQFDSAFSGTTIVYNAYGQVDSSTQLYAGSGGVSTAGTTSYLYDKLNRLKTETSPDGIVSGYAYSAVSTTESGYPSGIRAQVQVTRSKSPATPQVTKRRTTSQGQVIAVDDAGGSTTNFTYDPFANLVRVASPTSAIAGSPVVTMGYDVRGRKTSIADPDLGSWSFAFNGAGELKTQTDARGLTTTFEYDELRRPTVRVENAPAGQSAMTTTWTYDNACSGGSTSAIGQACQIAVSGGATTRLFYDSQARPFNVRRTIQGKSYDSYTLFDALGRPRYFGYPQSVPGYIYGVYRSYNASGYVTSVTDVANRTLWEALARYQDGQPYVTRIGGTSGLTTTRGYDSVGRPASIGAGSVQNLSYGYDALGNVSTRSDTAAGYSDSFQYDALNRLTVHGGKSFGYDPLGNRSSKSDLPGSFAYAPNSHRLTAANGRSYTHDANGNVQTDGLRTITPNAFNLPSTIVGNGKTLAYEYDGAHARVREVVTGGNPATVTTSYVGNAEFEEVTDSAGGLRWKHYVSTPEGPVAVAVTQGTQTLAAPEPALTYWQSDGLGSIVAESDSGGGGLQRLGFDAWGKRRNGNGTDLSGAFGMPANIGQLATQRGYTSQEMLDEIGLVHMNGRLYDPWLGRFVSADPVVQSPYDLQSYNRYAYVRNNPLLYTDPSGFSFWTRWRGPILGIAAAWALGPYGLWAAQGGLGGLLIGTQMGVSSAAALGEAAGLSGIFGGFAAGGVAGGNFESAVQGAIFAGINFGIGDLTMTGWGGPAGQYAANVGLHAAAGCAQQAAAGGSCGAGAASGGFSAAAGPGLSSVSGGSFATGLAGRVAIGAVASRLAGDKAQNGAMTAAFEYLFNEVAGHFDRTTGVLKVADLDTGRDASGLYFSGRSAADAVPPGEYDILERRGKDEFRLEPRDRNYGDDVHDATGRSLFRLHGPGISNGCITACDAVNWSPIRDLINQASTSNVTVNSYWGPSFFGGYQPFRFQTGTETVKKFGTLRVQ